MHNSKQVIVIPARYASTRFPGKPLTLLAGKPMIRWVYEAAKKLSVDDIVIATDDQRIADECAHYQTKVLMTSSEHQTGSDRLAEVVQQLNLSDDTIVINLQGDEPLTPLLNLTQLADSLVLNPKADMATLATPIEDMHQFLDPNVVKVVSNAEHIAQYFSRSPIPFNRGSQAVPVTAMRHIGMYAYRAYFLKEFAQLTVPDMESAEQLEQLRAVHAGYQIYVEQAREVPPVGVDTEADAERVSMLLQQQQA